MPEVIPNDPTKLIDILRFPRLHIFRLGILIFFIFLRSIPITVNVSTNIPLFTWAHVLSQVVNEYNVWFFLCIE